MTVGPRTVAVSFPASPEFQSALADVLGGAATLAFLAGQEDEDRRASLGTADALMCWNLERELTGPELAGARAVRFVQLLSAGADHVPFERIPDWVVVASNAGAYAEPMAEHVVAMASALAKRLAQKHAELARGVFRQRPYNLRIEGSVCGILGLGGIGKAAAHRFRDLGASIHAINTTGATEEPVDFVGTLAQLDAVLGASDILVVALPLTRQTRDLIGKRELGLMKPEAILVNVARAAIIDEGALYQHLREHPEFTVAIDVWWQEPFEHGDFRTDFPFFELPNFLGSPHNSAFVPGVELEGVRRAAENVLRYLEGQPIAGVVRRDDYQA